MKPHCVCAMVLAVAMLAPATGAEDFSFVHLCDPQLCRYGCSHDLAMFTLAVDYINDLRPALVLIGGDLTDMVKSDGNLDHFLEACGQFNMPYYCVPGNNDLGMQPSRVLLEQFRTYVGPDRFSLQYGGIAFVGVNTQLWRSVALYDETLSQDMWLQSTLAQCHDDGLPVIVFGHYPLFYTSFYEMDIPQLNLPPDIRVWLLSLFQQNGAMAYLAGHTHATSTKTHGGIQFITTPATCGNNDESPLGFRVFDVSTAKAGLTQHYVTLDSFYDGGRDSDGDGLSDAREDANRNNIVDAGETDRKDADTDDDGLADGRELSFGLDPLVADAERLPAGTPAALALLMALATLAAWGTLRRRARQTMQPRPPRQA